MKMMLRRRLPILSFATLSLSFSLLILIAPQHHVARVECKTLGGVAQPPPKLKLETETEPQDRSAGTTSARAGRHMKIPDIPFLSSESAKRLLAKATRVVDEEEEEKEDATSSSTADNYPDGQKRHLNNAYGYGYNKQYNYNWGNNNDDADDYFGDDGGAYGGNDDANNNNANNNNGNDYYRYGGRNYYNRYGEYWNGEEGAENNYAQNYGGNWNYWNGNEYYSGESADGRQYYYGNGYNAAGYNNGYYGNGNNNNNGNNGNDDAAANENYDNANAQGQYNANGGNGYYANGQYYNQYGESMDSEDWRNWQAYNNYKYNQYMYNQQYNNNNNNNQNKNQDANTSWMKRYSLKFEGCLDRRQNSGQKLLARFKLCPASASCVLCPNAGEYIIPLSDLVEAYDEMQPTGMDMYGTNWEALVDCSPIFGGSSASYTAASYYGEEEEAAENENSLNYFVGASCVDGGVYLGTFKDAFCTKPAPDGTHEELMGYTLPTYNLVSKKCIACNSAAQKYGYEYEAEEGQYGDDGSNKWWDEYQGFTDAEGVCQALYASAGKCESHMEGNPHPNNEACKFMHSGPWRIAKILIPFLLGITCFFFLLYFLRIHIERCAGHDAQSILNEPLHHQHDPSAVGSLPALPPPRISARNDGGVSPSSGANVPAGTGTNKASTFGLFHSFFQVFERAAGVPKARATGNKKRWGGGGGQINPIAKTDSKSDTVISELTDHEGGKRSWRVRNQKMNSDDNASKATAQTVTSKAADSITNQPFEVGQGNIWLNKTDVFKKRSEKLADALFAVSEENVQPEKNKGFIV